MRFLKERSTHQIEINKSIFISILYPLNDIEDISTSLADAKLKFPKGNHYCYATIYGENGEHQQASDDGEPSRTAGIPILEVLKHHNLTNVLCVVVRYFGGIKLGSGGLVRAYTKAAADLIKTSTFSIKKIVPVYEITFPYSLVNLIDHQYKEKVTILQKTFLENVTYQVILLDLEQSLIHDLIHQLISIKELEPKVLYIDEL
jgi:uncharacterized YigZ family protein